MLGLLLSGPDSLFGLFFGSTLSGVYLTLSFLPLVLLVLATGLAVYFQSTRLALMSLFLVFTYGYASLPQLLPAIRTLPMFDIAYYNSRILLPILIPLTVLGLHFTGDTGLFSASGLFKTTILFTEFVLLLILFATIPETLYDVLDFIPQQRILGGRLNVPFLAIGLALFVYGVMKVFSGQNYYSSHLYLLFWVVVTAQLAFVSGMSWTVRSFPMHQALFFSAAGILLDGEVLILAREKAYRDRLTGIPGRVALEEALPRLSGRYAICMVGIDEFDDFNETYGHDAGEKILTSVAQTLQRKSSGRAFRFGGDEFTIFYTGREMEEVEEELDALGQAIAEKTVRVTRKSKRATKLLERSVTVSMGVADFTGRYDSPEQVLNAADKALSSARDQGGNQLVVKNQTR